MKHLKRMGWGLLVAALILWPFLVWWNNVATAEAAAALWIKFLMVLLVLYAVGAGVDAWMKRKGRNGNR